MRINTTFGCGRIDPWFVFADADQYDLWVWAQQVWFYKKGTKEQDLRIFFPYITHLMTFASILQQGSVRVRMRRREQKMAIAGYLRLAFVLPLFSADQRERYKSMKKRNIPETSVDCFMSIHRENIGAERAWNLVAAASPKLSDVPRANQDVRNAAATLARAYGHDPETMTWSEIEALWDNGPAGLEKAKTEVRLGMHDRFRREVA